jgi:magnesium-transporting ATPase (P-type)
MINGLATSDKKDKQGNPIEHQLFERLKNWAKESFNQWKESFYLVARSFLWFFITLFFSVILHTLIVYIVSRSYNVSFSHEKIILDGVLVIFSATVISSLIIDYFYFAPAQLNRFAKIIYSFIPFSMLSVCMALLVICYTPNEAKNIEFIGHAELWILFVTTAYAVIIKTEDFRKKDSIAK